MECGEVVDKTERRNTRKNKKKDNRKYPYKKKGRDRCMNLSNKN